MEEKRNVPKLRFPGFTDSWEQRRLGECGTTYGGLSGKTKEDFGHGEARFVPYTNIFENPIADTGRLESIEIDPKQNQVRFGDAFFTVSSETPEDVGMSSVWLSDQPNVYLNSFCFGYRQDGSFDSDYLAYMLRSQGVRYDIVLLAQGISRFNISKNKVMELDVPFPEKGEQELIGTFFRKLDSLIALHQRKLDHVKELKKGLLQKMFPKEGANVPELRFPGFTDPWEQRRLGEIGSVAMCKRVYKDQTTEAGDVPFFKIGTFGGEPDAFISNELFEKYRELYSFPKIGDILISAAGTIGRTIVYQGERAYYQDSNIVWLNHDERLDNSFFLQYLNNQTWSSLEGSTLKRLYNKDILDANIALPKPDEQHRIGALFRKLDSLIALHQRELDHVKELKKGLLQQMFV